MKTCTDLYHIRAMQDWREFLAVTSADRGVTEDRPAGRCAACGTPIVYLGKVPSEWDLPD